MRKLEFIVFIIVSLLINSPVYSCPTLNEIKVVDDRGTKSYSLSYDPNDFKARANIYLNNEQTIVDTDGMFGLAIHWGLIATDRIPVGYRLDHYPAIIDSLESLLSFYKSQREHTPMGLGTTAFTEVALVEKTVEEAEELLELFNEAYEEGLPITTHMNQLGEFINDNIEKHSYQGQIKVLAGLTTRKKKLSLAKLLPKIIPSKRIDIFESTVSATCVDIEQESVIYAHIGEENIDPSEQLIRVAQGEEN